LPAEAAGSEFALGWCHCIGNASIDRRVRQARKSKKPQMKLHVEVAGSQDGTL